LDVALLPIPVRLPEFLAKVPNPTEAELKDLFEQYKNLVYDPASPHPGFKQPERIRVEWVKPDLAQLRQEAGRAAQVIRGVRQLADGAATPLGGAPAATAVAALLPSAFDTSLLAQYEDAKRKGLFKAPAWT